ncbi:MAG: ATP-binding protein [Ignavibacteriaceae bacterium]|nr:ATP-binding protein [Ignavibacteriaceae bacterium]
MFIRKQLSELQSRIQDKNHLIQVITGPRQVGKTTLASQLVDKIQIPYSFISADAVPSSLTTWVEQQWEAARIKLKNSDAESFLLIIDEIQKIHNWSEVVKKLYDQDRRNKINLKVILLGSSTLMIAKGLTESLTGRFELIQLPHWTYSEMNEAFGLTPEQFVYFGSYPGSAIFISDEKRWRDYILNSIIEPTISKDILQLTAIQKPALLKSLFEHACLYNSEILSYNKMLGQLLDAGNTTTLSHYQRLLDSAWMITGLQKFSGSTVKIKSSTPKLLTYNTAFVSVYSNVDFATIITKPELWGRRVEQSVGAYLLNQSRIHNFDLFYWREGNAEVDFVLRKNKKLVTVEVKAGKVKFHEGLELFKKKYKPAKSILISEDNLSWQEFIKTDTLTLFV